MTHFKDENEAPPFGYGKEDPLRQRRRTATLWLDRAGMLEARENYFHAFQQTDVLPNLPTSPGLTPKQVWDISFAAAVAAFDFLAAGRLTP